ncbi:hypothetical protein HWV62_17178 [Athelia sp. TMB]|nr:hypothetical protein HWV62_17178 [Athelia sp. TMB]
MTGVSEFSLQNLLIASGLLALIWKLLAVFTKHPFDNLPGPPSPSFIYGLSTELLYAKFISHAASVPGSIKQFRDPHGWAFHQSIAETYGSVVKYRGLFNLRDAILARVNAGPQEIDMLHWFGRAALEFVGQSGLGAHPSSSTTPLSNRAQHGRIQLRQPGRGPRAPVHPRHQELRVRICPLIRIPAAHDARSPTAFRLQKLALFVPHMARWGSPALLRWLVERVPSADVQSLREMVDLMDATSHEVLRSKQGGTDVPEKVGGGKDVMSILLNANKEAKAEDRLTDAELVGQVTTLVFAATDTTSSALARLFHLLAQHPDVQARLRDEIHAARNSDGDLDYKQLDSLQYLDAVIRETLRLAKRDTVLPLARPIAGRDGAAIRQLAVPKGAILSIAIMRANCDLEVWGADAHEWKPERWLAALPENAAAARFPGVYSNMLVLRHSACLLGPHVSGVQDDLSRGEPGLHVSMLWIQDYVENG